MQLIPGSSFFYLGIIDETSRSSNNLKFHSEPCDSKTFDPMNKQCNPYESAYSTDNYSDQLNENFTNYAITPIETTRTLQAHKRTVFVRHKFQANVKKTSTRWIRETPV